MTMTIVLLTFVAILAIVLVPYWVLVQHQESTEHRALRKRLKVSAGKSLARPDLLQVEQPLSTVPGMQRVLSGAQAITNPVKERIAQADANTTVGVVVLSSVFVGILTVALGLWLTGWILIALPIGVASTFVPFLILSFLATRRSNKFEEQFPEAIDLLARALRAGHAFTTGLQMVADELPAPVGSEFRLVYDRQAFGMPITDALRDMARRVPLLDARFFVTAVLTQRESGGNLAEVLDNLSTLMRDRFTVKRQVRTVSAHGRITGVVLGGLAPVLAVILFFISPTHMSLLFFDPLGQAMVAGAVVLQLIGVMAIRKIVNIEV